VFITGKWYKQIKQTSNTLYVLPLVLHQFCSML